LILGLECATPTQQQTAENLALDAMIAKCRVLVIVAVGFEINLCGVAQSDARAAIKVYAKRRSDTVLTLSRSNQELDSNLTSGLLIQTPIHSTLPYRVGLDKTCTLFCMLGGGRTNYKI